MSMSSARRINPGDTLAADGGGGGGMGGQQGLPSQIPPVAAPPPYAAPPPFQFAPRPPNMLPYVTPERQFGSGTGAQNVFSGPSAAYSGIPAQSPMMGGSPNMLNPQGFTPQMQMRQPFTMPTMPQQAASPTLAQVQADKAAQVQNKQMNGGQHIFDAIQGGILNH